MFEKERSDLAAYLNDYTEKEKKRIENDIAFHINSLLAAEKLIEDGEYKEACAVLIGVIEPTDQNNWGVAFYKGLKVPQDNERAYKWFTKAFEQGDKGAAKALCAMYFGGTYVQKDYTQAFKYLKIAADDGDSECQWAIGEMLIDGEVDGEGVDADEEEGVKCLEKSARGGHKEAKKSLEERRGASNNQANNLSQRAN